MAVLRFPVRATAFACVVLTASGCSSSPSSPSRTPPLSAGMGTLSQRSALLTGSNVMAIPGGPPGLTVTTPSRQGALFQDPDPRSPCGARVTLPDFSQGAQVQLDAASFVAFQVVVDLPVSEATAFATAWQKDTRPGCPPFLSKSNTGSSQIADLVSPVPMPALADQATGTWSTLNDNGQTVNSYGLVLRTGGRLAFDVLIAPAPLPEVFVVGFAYEAEFKLKGSLGSS